MERSAMPVSLAVEVERASDIDQAVAAAVAKWIEERARVHGLSSELVRGMVTKARIEITVVTE